MANISISELNEEIGRQFITYLVARTLNGIDIHGKKFIPYSLYYAKKKGVPRDKVDLRSNLLHKHMLQSIIVDVQDSGYKDFSDKLSWDLTITLTLEKDADDRTKWNRANGREWFNISDKETLQIIKDIENKPLYILD